MSQAPTVPAPVSVIQLPAMWMQIAQDAALAWTQSYIRCGLALMAMQPPTTSRLGLPDNVWWNSLLPQDGDALREQLLFTEEQAERFADGLRTTISRLELQDAASPTLPD